MVNARIVRSCGGWPMRFFADDHSPFEDLKIQSHLYGFSLMRPTLENQKMWALRLEPDLSFSGNVWQILQRYTMPLIKRHGCRQHNEGISRLRLDREEPPQFDEFRSRMFDLSGWTVVESTGEIEPREFFSMLARKEFPTVKCLRPLHAVFCGFAPDFWHEAIGHLSLLTCPEFSAIYQKIGLRLSQEPDRKTFGELLKLYWILLEYGMVLQDGFPRVFGAAFVGSFMALQRLDRKYIALRRFQRGNVLKSRLYPEGRSPRRSWNGKIEFYVLDNLAVLLQI